MSHSLHGVPIDRMPTGDRLPDVLLAESITAQVIDEIVDEALHTSGVTADNTAPDEYRRIVTVATQALNIAAADDTPAYQQEPNPWDLA